MQSSAVDALPLRRAAAAALYGLALRALLTDVSVHLATLQAADKELEYMRCQKSILCKLLGWSYRALPLTWDLKSGGLAASPHHI